MRETIQEYLKKSDKEGFERTRYLLERYRLFKKQELPLSKETSLAYMEIVSNAYRNRCFSGEDRMILDKAGPYLVKALEDALDIVRSFPVPVGSSLFTVLFYRYFLITDGEAESDYRNSAISENIDFDQPAINRSLILGIQVMQELLFGGKEESALKRACDPLRNEYTPAAGASL